MPATAQHCPVSPDNLSAALRLSAGRGATMVHAMSAAQARTARTILALSTNTPAEGFTVSSLRAAAGFPMDPFLNVDHFRMSQPIFPPHPHAGFSAVTVMFEDSPGGFLNRDSLGDSSRIGPGGLHWTQAGRGMMHEEVPERRGVEGHGLQIFVNLRIAEKLIAPRAFHVDAAEVPVVDARDGARVRVLCGAFEGRRSPLDQLSTPVLLLDVHLDPGARVTVPVPREQTAFALSIAGSGHAGGSPFGPNAAVSFAEDGDALSLAAGSEGLHVVVGAGAPLREPVVFGGPFAMGSREAIEDAYARYRRGDMGRLV